MKCPTDCVLIVHERTGETTILDDGSCAPTLFLCNEDDDRWAHVTQRMFYFGRKSSLWIKMLNQFCGLRPGGTEFAKELINYYDGCLQCSPYGPDVFPLLPAGRDNDDPLWFLIRPPDEKVKPELAGVPALLVTNKNGRQKSRNQKIDAAKANNDELVERYNRQPQLIVDASAMSAVAVVTNSDGSPTDLAKARQIPVNLSDKFFVQSPTDHANRSTSQHVYAMLKGQLKLMM